MSLPSILTLFLCLALGVLASGQISIAYEWPAMLWAVSQWLTAAAVATWTIVRNCDQP